MKDMPIHIIDANLEIFVKIANSMIDDFSCYMNYDRESSRLSTQGGGGDCNSRIREIITEKFENWGP